MRHVRALECTLCGETYDPDRIVYTCSNHPGVEGILEVQYDYDVIQERFDEPLDGRIAHSGLVAGTISVALARFPGVVIYLSQDLEFREPVELGRTVTATCEIVEALGESRYRLETTAVDEAENTVIAGEAVVVINPPPAN